MRTIVIVLLLLPLVPLLCAVFLIVHIYYTSRKESLWKILCCLFSGEFDPRVGGVWGDGQGAEIESANTGLC